MDFRDPGPPPPPWNPHGMPRRDPGPSLTPRQGRVLVWAIGVNLVMLLLGPFAGSSVVDALVALWR